MAYQKGINAERQLIRLLKDRDYEANRTVGSRGAADIFAAKKGMLGFGRKKFVIQVKATSSEKVRIPKDDIKKLISKELDKTLKKGVKKILEDELSKALKSKATKEEIGEITKKVMKQLYKDLSYHHPYIIDRIKV